MGDLAEVSSRCRCSMEDMHAARYQNAETKGGSYVVAAKLSLAQEARRLRPRGASPAVQGM